MEQCPVTRHALPNWATRVSFQTTVQVLRVVEEFVASAWMHYPRLGALPASRIRPSDIKTPSTVRILYISHRGSQQHETLLVPHCIIYHTLDALAFCLLAAFPFVIQKTRTLNLRGDKRALTLCRVPITLPKSRAEWEFPGNSAFAT